ncbi:MAG: hypothetical protein K0R98_2043 [Rickettsiaceae bacterium]|jgi:hypothetical protein|nr:hypothetical protein [Rickettsiaceae bacterium]
MHNRHYNIPAIVPPLNLAAMPALDVETQVTPHWEPGAAGLPTPRGHYEAPLTPHLVPSLREHYVDPMPSHNVGRGNVNNSYLNPITMMQCGFTLVACAAVTLAVANRKYHLAERTTNFAKSCYQSASGFVGRLFGHQVAPQAAQQGGAVQNAQIQTPAQAPKVINWYRYDVSNTLTKGLLIDQVDCLAKYPAQVEELLQQVCVRQKLDKFKIEKIIKDAFANESLSQKDANNLAENLQGINDLSNKSCKDLFLHCNYKNREIPHMVESAARQAIMADWVEKIRALEENSPRVPAALSASSSGALLGR